MQYLDCTKQSLLCASQSIFMECITEVIQRCYDKVITMKCWLNLMMWWSVWKITIFHCASITAIFCCNVVLQCWQQFIALLRRLVYNVKLQCTFKPIITHEIIIDRNLMTLLMSSLLQGRTDGVGNNCNCKNCKCLVLTKRLFNDFYKICMSGYWR